MESKQKTSLIQKEGNKKMKWEQRTDGMKRKQIAREQISVRPYQQSH